MDFKEFLEELLDDSDAMYDRAIDDMAGAIMAMSAIHDKSLEQIGQDLNAKVQELKEAEDDGYFI